MHPQLVDIHIGLRHFPIGTYGVLIIVGVTIAILLSMRRAPRFDVLPVDVLHVGLIGVGAGITGAIALYFAIHFRELLAHPEQPGLVFYGGLAGGGLGGWLYCRGFGVSVAAVADAGAPGLAIGHAIGRLGCLAGGCCYGSVSDVPWAVMLQGAPRHPVQAYEAIGLVVLAGVLFALGSRRRRGTVFAVYIVGYACLRIVTEAFRGDADERGMLGPLSTSQLVAVLVLMAVAVWSWRRRHTRVNG